MMITRFFTKTKASKIEKLTGVRIASTTYELRNKQKPKFISVDPGDKNK